MFEDNLDSQRQRVELLNTLLARGWDVQIANKPGEFMLHPAAFFVGSPPKEDVVAGNDLNFPVFAVIQQGCSNEIKPETLCVDKFPMEIRLISPEVMDWLYPSKKVVQCDCDGGQRCEKCDNSDPE